MDQTEVLQIRIRRSDTLAEHATITAGTVQGTTFCSRNNPLVRPLVSPIWPQLPKSGRDDGGAESVGGSFDDLALGAALRTRTGPALPSRVAFDECFLAGR